MDGDGDGAVRVLSAQESREQKLKEYLAAKGKLKPPNPKPYLRDNMVRPKQPVDPKAGTVPARKQKENQPPPFRPKGTENKPPSTAAGTRAPTKPVPYPDKTAQKKSTCNNTIAKTARPVKTNSTQSTTRSKPGLDSAVAKTSQCKSMTRAPIPKTALNKPNIQSAKPATVPKSTVLHSASAKASSRMSASQAPVQLATNSGPAKAARRELAQRKPQVPSARGAHSSRVGIRISAPGASQGPASVQTGSTGETQLEELQRRHSALKRALGRAASVGGREPGLSGAGSSDAHSKAKGSSPLKTLAARREKPRAVPAESRRSQKSSGATEVQQPGVCGAAVGNSWRTGAKAAGVGQQGIRGGAAAPGRRHTFVVREPVGRGQLPHRCASSFSSRNTAPAQVPTKSAQQGQDPGPKRQEPARNATIRAGTSRTAAEQGSTELTKAQEERMRRLQEWREAKGIAYKRPPMPTPRRSVKKPAASRQSFWSAMEEEDRLGRLAAERIDDCLRLLREGRESREVLAVLSQVPSVEKFAMYWVCRARLMERDGDCEVLALFEEAVRVVQEPIEELRTIVFEILKKKKTITETDKEGDQSESNIPGVPRNDPVTPKIVGAKIRGAKNGSSVVKYKITATPGGRQQQQQRDPVQLDGQELRFFTPVRRSLRIERAAPRYPAALQERDPCVASLQELLAEEEGSGPPLYVYRENEALNDQIHIELLES
nr:PREDICTED: cytoskeleton-associated protein 2-like isoform X1 [Lepisosteus oculatus]